MEHPDGASFNGSSCVNSGILGQGPVNLGPVIKTYSVSFPSNRATFGAN